jgi:hypothetical protein
MGYAGLRVKPGVDLIPARLRKDGRLFPAGRFDSPELIFSVFSVFFVAEVS